MGKTRYKIAKSALGVPCIPDIPGFLFSDSYVVIGLIPFAVSYCECMICLITIKMLIKKF